MKNVTINTKKLTPDQIKKLLENHDAVIESLQIISEIIPNPIVKIMVKAMISLCNFVLDTILSQSKK